MSNIIPLETIKMYNVLFVYHMYILFPVPFLNRLTKEKEEVESLDFVRFLLKYIYI